MTEGGISKKVFFGVLLGTKLADIAVAETDPGYKCYFFFGLVGLIVIYWAKQAVLDYMKDIKKKSD